MKAKKWPKKASHVLAFLALASAPGFCLGSRPQQTSFSSSSLGFSQHHNHNGAFEGHPRKVRRLQRLLLHNNRHTMQFRSEEEQGTKHTALCLENYKSRPFTKIYVGLLLHSKTFLGGKSIAALWSKLHCNVASLGFFSFLFKKCP